jgi:hypothetical protein
MKWPEHIYAEEFEDVARLHPDLIAGLGETRQVLGVPMTFSRSRAGWYHHPSGDAVAPTSPSHSPASLHRYDIDHSASYRRGRLVRAAGTLCKASDWDAGAASPEELWEQYLLVERVNVFRGLGIYPQWRRPGFHTDCRPSSHPLPYARWFAVNEEGRQTYYSLTWKLWKEHAL